MIPLAAPQGKSNRRLAAGSDEYSHGKLPNVVANSTAGCRPRKQQMEKGQFRNSQPSTVSDAARLRAEGGSRGDDRQRRLFDCMAADVVEMRPHRECDCGRKAGFRNYSR